MFDFITKFFKRKNKEKTVIEIIQQLQIGDLVVVEYKHPKQIGITSGETLSYTRLNREEINNRKIRGAVSAIRNKDLSHGMIIVEITTFESPAMPGKSRKMLFLLEEIDTIKKIG